MKLNPKQVRKYAVSAANFYGKAKTAYKAGQRIVGAVKTGAKVVKVVRDKSRQLTRRPKPTHYTGNNAAHNDWNQLQRKTIKVYPNKPPKCFGTYQLVHAKDYIAEDIYTGFQAVGDGVACFTGAHFKGTLAANINAYQTQWATDPFLLNPFSVPPTANTIYTTASTVPIDGDRIIVKNVQSTIQVVSLCPTAIKIRIYWLLCNSNTDDLPKAAWTDVLKISKYLQPSAAAGPATTASTASTTGYEAYSLHGSELPKGFSKRWKTLHKDVFMLQPGDNISMTRTFIYNKIMSKEFITEMTGTYIKGWTLCPLVVQEGALVGIAADGETTLSTINVDRVTFARSKIGYLHTDKVTFGAVGANRYDIKRNEIGYIQNNAANITAIMDVDDEVINANPLG